MFGSIYVHTDVLYASRKMTYRLHSWLNFGLVNRTSFTKLAVEV